MAKYGAQETNPLPAGYHDEKATDTVSWTDSRLVRIERLRLLSDPGFPAWDVSYCFGRLADGTKVAVALPFDQLPRGRRAMLGALIEHANRDHVNLKRLGTFEAISTLI